MLIDEIRSLPSSPGVYQYFDEQNRLLYVGKAKNLKNRVKSYFSFTPILGAAPKLSARIKKMISEVKHLEYLITPSEADALILENSFIKQLKPKYNILLRDDKTYPYIFIDLNEDFPRFQITRKLIKGSNIRYFGPYFSGARELLEALYMSFKLVASKAALKAKGAYLPYQIGYSEAPLISKITPDEYKKVVSSAINALKNPNLMISNLTNLMMKYAQNENFEQAAKIRDKINAIKNLEIKVEVDLAKLEDFEVFAVIKSQNLLCAVRFSVQEGKIIAAQSNIASAKDSDESDIREAYKHIILQSFPLGAPVLRSKIYTLDSFDDIRLIQEILSQRHGRKFSISTPKIGEKRKICEIAAKNALANIQKYLKSHDNAFLEEIKEYFKLSHTPFVIEAFDNSHLFGQANVGAMVRFEHGEFARDNYRHMHLKSKNDYDQMRESLSARALRFDKLSAPDLWVIDGGQALLDLASDIIKSSGANVDVIAISKEKIDAKAHRAKGGAKDKIYTQNGKFSLPSDDKKLQFFQRLRDESHRFVINFHQKSRQKEQMASSKLIKAGISKAWIAKLIKFYGNFENIAQANLDEIAKITNKNVATKLKKARDDELF